MHDQGFKNLILDYPREALAFFACEEVCHDLGVIVLKVRELDAQQGKQTS